MDLIPFTIFLWIIAISSMSEAHVSEETLKVLINQIELQQFQFQERIRSDGNSGIKQLRVHHSGTSNYHTESHTGRNVAKCHDHSNSIRTVGMGEFIAVLNGVEFKTRHNDYMLVMPSTNSSKLHESEPVPFPDVPPEVLKKTNVSEAILEMREWVKAWANQDYSTRDYRKYFKPVLCYLEGAWFKSNLNQKIQESFKSSRHFLDASSWQMLHERAQFMAYTGGKSRLENLAVLPTAFMGMINATNPQLAQWNYRILCHPLKDDLPLKALRPVEDLSGRFFRNKKWTMKDFANSRAARFLLNSKTSANLVGQFRRGLLDELMEQIPGKDNYPGKIFSKPNDDEGVLKAGGAGPINQAYYHRWYQMKDKDASGLDLAHRSFSDEYLFAARNTQQDIAGRRYQYQKKKARPVTPEPKYETWSWAIPLEVIYLTPLLKWNPYKLKFHTDVKKTVTENGKRNGECKVEKAFKGSDRKLYFRTPANFFTASAKSKTKKGAADTVKGSVCALDESGNMKEVVASGVYVHLPPIEGLEKCRIRYPVLPVHGEGSSVWKELNALRTLVMDTRLRQSYTYVGPAELEGSMLSMRTSRKGEPHQHNVELSGDEMKMLNSGSSVNVTSEQVHGHTHTLTISRNSRGRVMYHACDGSQRVCMDKHPRVLDKVK